MEDKKILITGAGSGLGKACSRFFSRLGAHLCLFSGSQEKLHVLQAELDYPSEIYAVDFREAHAVEATITDMLARNFIPDIILHCAGGGFKKHDPLLSRADLGQLLDINLCAATQINHHIIPKMIERHRGVVIHVGSTASDASCGSVAYNTAKSALAAYVRSLGRALASTGVVVTGISPGSFMAEGNNMFDFKQEDFEKFERFSSRLPAMQLCPASDIVSVIKMIADHPGPLFCGCMLPIDAGEGLAYTR